MNGPSNVAAELSSHEQRVRDFLATCHPDDLALLEEWYPTLSRRDWQRIEANEEPCEDVDQLIPEDRPYVGVALRAHKPVGVDADG